MLHALKAAGRSLPRTGAEELAGGSDLLAGSEDRLVVDLMGSAEAEAFSGTMIKDACDLIAASLGEVSQRGAFGQILTDEAVGVLVGAALPGMVRSSEVDGGAKLPFDFLVAVELGTVVRGDRVDRSRLPREELDEAGVRVLDGGARQGPNAHEAALALDDRYDAGLTLTVDGVGLPVAAAAAAVHDRRPRANHALAGEPPAAVVATIALSPPLAGTPEVTPERAPILLIPPDVQIDDLMAHHGEPLASSPTDDLLGTPLLRNQCFDGREVRRLVAGVPPRAAAPCVRHLHRHRRPIRRVVGRGVALHLARDRAAVPPQRRRNFRRRQSLLTQRRDLISFPRVQLPICHSAKVSHLLPESKEPNKAPEPTPLPVTPPAEPGVAPGSGVAHL